MQKNLSSLKHLLEKAKTEEDIKHAWAKVLGIDYNTSDDHDLYTPQVLFEFKYKKNFSSPAQLATVFAQLLYYLNRLKFGVSTKGIPASFCLADHDHVVMGEVEVWKDFYTDEAGKFDWDLRPSSPDLMLVEAVQKHPAFKKLHVYKLGSDSELTFAFEALQQRLSPQLALAFGDKKAITEENFEEVYQYWNALFGDSVVNKFKPSRYFVSDIWYGRSQLMANTGEVYFKIDEDNVKVKKITAHDHEHFWSLYDKVTDPQIVRGILAKADRLTEDVERRKHGEFFTPLPFAKKALAYIEKEIGKAWWKRGNVRLWDMAAGTGNLQYHLPYEALACTYLSTLYEGDVEHCNRLFPGATVFQYDYLNDDVGNVFNGHNDIKKQTGFEFDDVRTWKLPETLRRDLANPDIQWIILINPPFATAQQGGAKGANKADVSKTRVRERMHQDDLGEVSRELFAQFLYRIRREFKGKTAWLGLFSKLKYINATNDQKLRDTVFQYKFCRGLMFSSVNFSGTSRSSQFPVGFLLWDLKRSKTLDAQTIALDVFDNDVQKIDSKIIASDHRDQFLSKWIDRPEGVAIFPPFSSAITVKTKGPDIRDRISHDFLGSLMCAGNDIQHQNMTSILSGPYASAGGHSITPKIFEQAMVVHAVRRLPKAQWHNDRDQFMQPGRKLPEDFITDCVLWSLFAHSNATVAMRDVKYERETYQVANHFFPFLLKKIRKWKTAKGEIALQLPTAEDRFVARWLAKRTLSKQAQSLLDAGENIYQRYFESLNELRTAKFKIDTWDAGWWQIRMALENADLATEELAALKEAHLDLREKLLPKLNAFGFLG